MEWSGRESKINTGSEGNSRKIIIWSFVKGKLEILQKHHQKLGRIFVDSNFDDDMQPHVEMWILFNSAFGVQNDAPYFTIPTWQGSFACATKGFINTTTNIAQGCSLLFLVFLCGLCTRQKCICACMLHLYTYKTLTAKLTHSCL